MQSSLIASRTTAEAARSRGSEAVGLDDPQRPRAAGNAQLAVAADDGSRALAELRAGFGAPNRHAAARPVEERAGKWPRDRPHQPIDVRGRQGPVDAPVLGAPLLPVRRLRVVLRRPGG